MAFLGLSNKVKNSLPQNIKDTIGNIDSFNKIVNQVATGDFSGIFDNDNAILKHRNDAVKRFGLDSGKWNIPKRRTFFYVNFQTISMFDQKYREALREASSAVKVVDRPSHVMELTELNEYNRKRVINGKIKYEPVQIIFYDTINSGLMKVLHMYKRFHWADFSRFHKSQWENISMDTPLNDETENDRNPSGWGYHNYLDRQFDRNNYFFKQIDIFEFFDDKFTVYNLINPRISQILYDPRDVEQIAPSEIIVRFDYEGLTHRWPTHKGDIIGQKITRDIANFVGMPWEDSILDPITDIIDELEDTLELAIGGALMSVGQMVQGVIDSILREPIEGIRDTVKDVTNEIKTSISDIFKIDDQTGEKNSGVLTGKENKRTDTPTLDF